MGLELILTDFPTIVLVISVIARLAMGTLMWVIGPRHPATVLLGSYLMVSAAGAFAVVMRGLETYEAQSLAAATPWAYVAPYYLTVLPFLLIAFGTRYPRRSTWLGTRAGGWALLAAALSSVAIYAWRPETWVTLRAFDSREVYLYEGPMATLLGVQFLLLGWLAWHFARHAKGAEGHLHASLVLLSLGFAVNTVYDAAAAAVAMLLGELPVEPVYLAAAFGLLPVALAIRHMRTSPHFRPFVAGVAVASSLSIIPILDLSLATGALPPMVNALSAGLIRLTWPAILAYGMLRHHLLGVDMFAKQTFKGGLLTSMPAAAFFIISEGLEQMVPVDSTYLALATAGAIALAIQPIRRLTARITNQVFPGVSKDQAYLDEKRLEVYKTALETIMADGVVSPKEQRTLHALAERLQIDERTAQHLQAAY